MTLGQKRPLEPSLDILVKVRWTTLEEGVGCLGNQHLCTHVQMTSNGTLFSRYNIAHPTHTATVPGQTLDYCTREAQSGPFYRYVNGVRTQHNWCTPTSEGAILSKSSSNLTTCVVPT